VSVTFLAGSVGDTIALAGNAAGYTAVLSGSQVTLKDTATGATIVLPAGTTTTSVSFDDGVYELVLDTTGETPAITLGGTAVTDTETTVTGEPVEPPAETPTFELTASNTNLVAEGQDISFTVTPSVASDTETTLYVQISGAAVGAITAQATADDFSAVLLPVTIPAGSTEPVVVSATVNADAVTEGPEGFQAKLLDSSFNVVADAAAVTGTITEGVSSGQTFTLTTGVDNFVGGSSNDTFNGSIQLAAGSAANTSTLSVADTLNGGAGTDSLNLTVSGEISTSGVPDNYNVPAADISGTEKLFIRQLATDGTGGPGTVTVNASNIPGVTEVWSDRSTGDKLVVSNLATGAAIGMKGNGTAANGDIDFTYATATDPVTVAVEGGTKQGTISNTGASAATATINVTGTAANTLTAIDLGTGTNVTSLTINADANLKTALAADYANTAALTVTGDSAVDIGANGTFKTVDASANTGGLTMTLDTVATSVKGSAGNDVLTSAANYAVTTAGIIDAGAGTDTLVLSATTDADTAAEGALYTNFETLRVGGSQDVSLISGITALEVTSNGTFSKLNATQAGAVTVRSDIGASTFSLADSSGTSDALSLTMGTGSKATEATDITGALTINGFETLNIATAHGPDAVTADQETTIASFNADKLTAINLTGTSVDLQNAATTKAVTINGSALTGTLKVAGNLVAGSTVTGSAGKDTFTLGTAGSTYNAGAGDDTINGTAAQINTAADYNVIDGGEGTDTLNITGGGALTLVDNNLSKITNVEKVVIATTTTNDQTITTGGFFDTNWKTNGIDLTTTTTTGDVTIDMTSFTGAAKISATSVAAAAGDGVIDIQTGSGADDVTVSADATGTATGAGTVKTYGGNDKITTANDQAFTLVGGAGDDTYVLGSTGADTVEFSAIATNGVDTITGFTAGTDILKVSTLATLVGSATGGVDVVDTANAAAKADTATHEVAQIDTDAAADWADVASIIAQSATVAADTTAGNATTLFAIDNGTDTRLYLFQDDATSNATIEASELTLVGTISGLADATSVDLFA
jgi:hypothetical protein